jgi:hypothetical protein
MARNTRDAKSLRQPKSVSRNAVPVMHILLEASLFPERVVKKVQSLPQVQADEEDDAIHHRAVTYQHLVYEWGGRQRTS